MCVNTRFPKHWTWDPAGVGVVGILIYSLVPGFEWFWFLPSRIRDWTLPRMWPGPATRQISILGLCPVRWTYPDTFTAYSTIQCGSWHSISTNPFNSFQPFLLIFKSSLCRYNNDDLKMFSFPFTMVERYNNIYSIDILLTKIYNTEIRNKSNWDH